MFQDGTNVDFGHIAAENYDCQEKYWVAHAELIGKVNPNIIVCESYNLQGSKAKAQTGSSLDTPQMIGFLRMIAYYKGIEWILQHPQDKARVTDDILVKEGVFEKRGRRFYYNGLATIIHERDSLRHGFYYLRYGKGRD